MFSQLDNHLDHIVTKVRALQSKGILPVILLVSVALLLLSGPCLHGDIDLPWHLVGAKDYLTYGTIRMGDCYSFNATLPLYYNHQWLSSLIFYLFNSLAGDFGLIVLKLLVGFLTCALIYKAGALRERHTLASALLLYFCAFQSLYLWTSNVRARLFAYLLFAAVLYLVERYRIRKSNRALYGIPLLCALAANLHAEFVYCFLPLFALISFPGAAGRGLPIVILGISAAVTLINPWGFDFYTQYLIPAFFRAGSGRHVADWRMSPYSIYFAFKLCLVLVISYRVIIYRGKAHSPYESFLFIVTGVSAVLYDRTSALFYFTLAVWGRSDIEWVGSQLRAVRSDLPLVITRATVASLPVLVGLAIFSFVSSPPSLSSPIIWRDWPKGATTWLKANRAGGDILLPFNYGSYVLSDLGPRFKVSLDSRYDLIYSDGAVTLALNALTREGQDARSTLRPDFILLDVVEGSAPHDFLLEEGYVKIFSDTRFVMYERYAEASLRM